MFDLMSFFHSYLYIFYVNKYVEYIYILYLRHFKEKNTFSS